MRNLRNVMRCAVCAIAVCAMTTGAAVAATPASLPPTVTLETPAGPITCAVPSEPGWADVLETTAMTKLTAEVLSAGAVRCETSTYGEIELSGAGFPWKLTVNNRTRRAKLKNTKKLVLELTLLSLGAKCVYETGRLLGTLSTETPAVLNVSASRVKLNSTRSFPLCPAGGSLSGSIPLS